MSLLQCPNTQKQSRDYRGFVVFDVCKKKFFAQTDKTEERKKLMAELTSKFVKNFSLFVANRIYTDTIFSVATKASGKRRRGKTGKKLANTIFPSIKQYLVN